MKKRKRIKRSVRIVCISIAMGTAIFAGYHIYASYKSNAIEDTKKDTPIVEEEEIYVDKHFSLLATGDAVMHSPIYESSETSDGYDFSPILTELSDTLEPHDLKFINLEAPMANMTPSTYPTFNTPQQWLDDLMDVGFNMFSLANNHTMDKGEQGVLDTVEFINTKDNIVHSGMNSSTDDIRYVISEVNDITYGYVAYTEHVNGIAIPSGKDYLANIYSYDIALEDITYLSENVDVVIVSMHWGYEYKDTPNDYQKEVASELSEMGVDIILGNHPHWIQPIEIINDTVVIYSMGNFISNQMTIADQYPYTDSVTVGAIVTMDIYKEEDDNIRIENINAELIYSYKSSSGNFKVVPFSKMNETYASDYEYLYEKHKAVITAMNDYISVTSLN